MHIRTLIIGFLLVVVSGGWSFALQEETEEEKKRPALHRVGGKRDGKSFFLKTDYSQIQPLKEGELDFRHYHTYDEANAFLKRWAEEYTNILELYSVGQSFEGREIWQVTLTNKETGKDYDKPAMFIEGGRHSGEITSSESVLWLIDHILTNYGKDDEITKLVDTKTLYLKVMNNPDGSELYRQTAQSNRSTVRPHDTDRDGYLDEDPGDDLDGDGFIRQMRQKVDDGKGNAILDPRDESGRLMKRVGDNEGDWMVYSEGIDDDLDGKYNEDGIGGLDLHRNYVENWRPEPGHDETGRGWTQRGAGEFPLSENETRNVVMFLLTHPNVSIGQSMDTVIPMHLRAPSTSRSEERMFAKDIKWYEYFDEKGLEITHYPWAGDVYHDYRMRSEINRRTGEPNRPGPLFGHGPDFGYWYYGSIWYGDELWNGGRMKDYNEDGELDAFDSLTWDETERDGREFMEWTPFNHPQLGGVEIGGFNPKFASQNAPPDLLEEWASKQARFNLLLAQHLPQIEIVETGIKKLENGLFEVSVTFTNTGKLPTALEQAKLIKIVKPDTAKIEFDKELMKDKKIEIVDPELKDKSIEMGWLEEGEQKTATWKIRLNGIDTAKATISVLSTRGGLDKREVELQ
jgi:hypothetical protein